MSSDAVVGLFGGCETSIATVADDDELAVEQIGRRIALKQLYLGVLSMAMLFLATFVFLMSVFPGVGACTRDITFDSLPKIPFFVVSMCAALITHRSALFNFAQRPSSVFEWSGVGFFYHVLNIVGMVVLQISCILEFQHKTSILYQQNNGFAVIAFAAAAGLCALLSMFTGWRAWVYSRDVRALVMRWGIAPKPDDAKQDQQEESKKDK